ncbi:MAG TPA: TlpA disulfide reductase family protein [Minicystis sp.]|nr:TlpA disulfide reductase family protein [Minicystis sp.]
MRASLALAAAAAALAACGPPEMPPSLGHPLADAPAPPFHELSTSSWDVGLPAAPMTKVTVIDFWASWCGECERTIPALEQLYRDKQDDGVMVIGVSVDERAEDATDRALALRTTFPLVLDPHMAIAGRYRVAQIPLTFVVDRKGTVRGVGRDPDALRRAVDHVLGE